MHKIQANLKHKVLGFLVIAAVGIALAVTGVAAHLLEEIESRTWDWRLRLTEGSVHPDPDIKIVVIDQTSLDYFAREEKIFWPWPRGIYEAVLGFLTQAKARGVAFDVLFTEQSSYGVEDDQAFAKAIKAGLPVTTAVALRTAQSAVDDARLLDLKTRQLERNAVSHFAERFLAAGRLLTYPGITLPIQELLSASSTFGNVSAYPDGDGVFRHITIGGQYKDIGLLGLPFALYDMVQGLGGSTEFLKHYVDDRGRLAVRFMGPARSYRTYSIAAIIGSYQRLQNGQAPLVPLDDFRGSYVFVGMDAPGLLDLRPTPLAEVFPGVEYNATVLDNLLHHTFVRKANLVLNTIVISFLILAASAASIFFSRLRSQILGLGLVLVAFLEIQFYLASQGIWLQCALPLVCMALSVGASLAFQFQLEGRQHRFIKDAFKFYVSPSVIDRIVDDPSSLSLGGERRELTMFFSDIAGFTTISETVEAQKLVPLLNQFLSAMTDIIMQHGGTVDKYVGDAIVAFWNAPLPVSDHAAQAVKAAIECQKKLLDMREGFEREFGVALKMRIGLNTGEVSVGNFGSRERFNYTIIGDAANLASRLEGANKSFSTSILMAGSTQAACSGLIPTRKVADIRVVGKSEVISVYEPVFWSQAEGALGIETLKQFEAGLKCFEAGKLEEALELFSKAGKDPVARVYMSRINRDLAKFSGHQHEGWTHVWNLSEK